MVSHSYQNAVIVIAELQKLCTHAYITEGSMHSRAKQMIEWKQRQHQRIRMTRNLPCHHERMIVDDCVMINDCAIATRPGYLHCCSFVWWASNASRHESFVYVRPSVHSNNNVTWHRPIRGPTTGSTLYPFVTTPNAAVIPIAPPGVAGPSPRPTSFRSQKGPRAFAKHMDPPTQHTSSACTDQSPCAMNG